MTNMQFEGNTYALQLAPLDALSCDMCAFRKRSDCGDVIAVSDACLASGAYWKETGSATPGRQMILPTDPAERKSMPITTGVFDYFPLALAEVAKVSKAGNDQHNPGQPLHWDKTKSMDHADCIARHLIDRGTFDPTDTPPQRHSAKLAWRALALLEIELEQERAQ
jgi:hypothetical protein